MNTAPTILMANGKPAFVVLPYEEYLALTKTARVPADDSIPHEVVKLQFSNDWSLVRAWREYLGITQTEMAERLQIRQPTYANMEALDAKPRKATIKRIAEALNLSTEQVMG